MSHPYYFLEAGGKLNKVIRWSLYWFVSTKVLEKGEFKI